jgi:asparagine synthetase B (glutamine-hydrolysing)
VNRTAEPTLTTGPWAVWVDGAPCGGRDHLARTFVEHGTAALGDRPGSWALVAERRGETGLHVAVDAFGGAPLFVRGMEARRDPSGWRGPLEPAMIRAHLAGDAGTPARTWIRGVHRIPAGHGGHLGDPRALRPLYRPVGSTMPLREAVVRAVRDRRVDDPWVALSGGLDSAVVAACLAADGPVTAITNRFGDWSCDEGDLASATARRLGVPRHDVDSRTGMGRVLDLLAPPTFPPMLANHHLTLGLLAPDRVLFTGFGGDEVFGHGFDVVRELARTRPDRALLEAVALAIRYRHAEATVGHELSRWLREAARAVVHPPSPATLRMRRIRRFTDPLLSRSREEQLALATRVGARLVMPLLDPRVVAAVVERPASWRVRRGRTRQHVREAFADLLAPEVLQATTKADLSQTVRHEIPSMLDRYRSTIHRHIADLRLTSAEEDRLRRGLRGDVGPSAPWLFRVIGAARYLAWHTGA